MKHLPLKLGILVVLLFSAVIAVCLLWTPLWIRYYMAKLKLNNPKERVSGVESLLGMGKKGVKALSGELEKGEKEAQFIANTWRYWNSPIPNYVFELHPIHLAASEGYLSTVSLLLNKGANINAKTNTGRTPLHRAVMSNQISIVEFLLAKGADINAKDSNKQTPLHIAARFGRKDVAALLIGKGTDLNAKDNDGKTPLDTAIGTVRIKTERLLHSHGAKTGEELREEKK